MSKNDITQNDENRTIVTYENEAAPGTVEAELRTPDHDDSEVTFARMMSEPSSLHERILDEAQAQGIPTDIIDLPAVMSPQYDSEGDMYVTDMNNVVRYYVGIGAGHGQLVPTDEFIENARMVESNERTNSFAKLYNLA